MDSSVAPLCMGLAVVLGTGFWVSVTLVEIHVGVLVGALLGKGALHTGAPWVTLWAGVIASAAVPTWVANRFFLPSTSGRPSPSLTHTPRSPA